MNGTAFQVLGILNGTAFYVLGICPFLCGDFLDLHQTNLLCATSRVWIEAALPPHHRFNQCRVNSVTMGGVTNWRVLASFQASFPPPISGPAAQEEHDCNPNDSAQLHGTFLAKVERGVQILSHSINSQPEGAGKGEQTQVLFGRISPLKSRLSSGVIPRTSPHFFK